MTVIEDPPSYIDRADCRRVSNLVSPPYNDSTGKHSWLAHFKPQNTFNNVVFSLSTVISLAVIRLHNYSKTPCRGVNEFDCYLDGVLIYQGSCPPNDSVSILFDHCCAQTRFREQDNVFDSPLMQPVVFIDENRVMENPKQPSIATESKNQRPDTSHR
ncbi:hypothetical protein GEMRC1_006096 [Eukaryota sp. GEM-RC1]